MAENDERPPLLPDGPSVADPAQFLEITGFTSADLDDLLHEGLLTGGYSESGRLLGVLVDELPSEEELRAFGLSPNPGFAEALRGSTTEISVENEAEDPDHGDRSRGTMGWA